MTDQQQGGPRDSELEARLRERWAKTINDEDWERLDPELSVRPPPDETSAATLLFDAGADAETIARAPQTPDPGFDPAAPTLINARPENEDEASRATLITDAPATLPGPPLAGAESCWPARYRLEAELGRGGMGVIYRAHQASLRRDVAIKMSHPGRGSAGFQLRFLSEALVMGHLEHPNIVPVHDLGSSASGEGMLTMKLVAGTEWKALLHPGEDADDAARKKAADTRFHLDILKAVCHAIEYAHSKDIVHCDLKPENVMVGEFGEVYVMDWGLAVDVRDASEDDLRASHRSSIEAPCGTPAYMPPELAEGQGHRIHHGTDVYLLGAILHEIMTGRPPHTGDSLVAILLSATKSEPPRLDDSIPADLRAIILRALACKPEDRHPSVEALRKELEAFLIHRESLALSEAARRDLDGCHSEAERLSAVHPAAWPEAQRPAIYNRYADLVSRFKQSHALWQGNKAAELGVNEARKAFAVLALRNGDLGIAQSQVSELPPLDPETRKLREGIASRADERQTAERQARRNRLALVIAAALIFIGLVVGFALVKQQQLEADAARIQEARARKQAEESSRSAELARKQEARQRALAEEQRGLADRARLAAEQSRAQAEAAELKVRRQLAKSYVLRANSAFAARDWLRARDLFREAHDQYQTSGRPAFPVTLGLWACSRKLLTPLFSSEETGGRPTILKALPNSPLVLAGYQNGELRLWDLEQRRLLQTIRIGHRGSIRALAISADGRRVASASEGKGGSLRLWLLHDPTKRRLLDDPKSPGETEADVQALAFSPDGRRLFSGNKAGDLKWWDLRYINSVQRRRFSEAIVALAVSPDNHRVFIAQSWKATLFDLETYKTSDFAGREGARDLVLDQDGEHLLTVGQQTTLWNVAERPIAVRALGLQERGTTAALSPDGTRALVVGARDARLWDLARGELRSVIPRNSYAPTAAAFTTDGQGLVTAFGPARAFTLWRPCQAGSLDIRLPEQSRDLFAASARGRLLLSATRSEALLWDGLSGRLLARLDAGKTRIEALALSHDGRRLVLVQRRRLHLFDSLSGAELGAFDCEDSRPEIDFSPDDRALLLSTAKALILLDPDSAKEQRRWPAKSRPRHLCFAPKNPRRCLASIADELVLFDLERETATRRWTQKTSVGALGFTNDRSFLAVEARANRPGLAFVTRKVDEDGPGQRLEGRGDSGSGVRVWVSPDGEHALSIAQDDATRLWERRTGEEIVGLPSLGSGLKRLRFLQGEARLALLRRSIDGYHIALLDAVAPRRLTELEAELAAADKEGKVDQAKRLALLGRLDALRGDPRWANARLAEAAQRGAKDLDPLTLLEAALKAGENERAARLAEGLQGNHSDGADLPAYLSLLRRALAEAKDQKPEPATIASRIRCLAAFGDERVFLGLGSGEIQVYDPKANAVIGRMYGHRRAVTKLAYLEEREELLSLGDDGRLILWSVRTGQPLRFLRPKGETKDTATDFSLSQSQILARYRERLVVWESKDWRRTRLKFQLDTRSPALAFSSDPALLACLGRSDRAIIVRPLDQGPEAEKPPLEFTSAQGVVGLAFDAEGRLISCDRKGAVTCWDLERGAALWITRPAASWVRDIALDPDRRRALLLATGQRPIALDLTRAAAIELGGPAPKARSAAWKASGREIFVYTMKDTIITTPLAEER